MNDEGGGTSTRPFCIGEWLVEPSLNRLTRGDESAHLEPRAMDLLVFFSNRPRKVLSHETLIDGVWAEQFVGEGVLRQTIAAVRDALGDDAKNPTFIETIPKRGYRLIADVSEVKSEQSPSVKKQDEGFRPRWSHALAIAIASVIALIVILPPEGIWQRITNQEHSEPESRPRIVVLPLVNLGPPEDEYFADGVSEEIMSRLAAVSGLEVISRTSSASYKGAGKKIGQIGEELGVDFALEGTVRWNREGEGHGRVRITLQLIRVDSDHHLWSESYDRVMEDIVDVQTDVANQVIGKLEVALLDRERQAIDSRPTENMDAYSAYLRGLAHFRSLIRAKHELAGEMFERAVSLDAGFALAHAKLAGYHAHGAIKWPDAFPDGFERARMAANLALALDPNLPEAHIAVGRVNLRDGEREQALERCKIAARLQPSNVEVLKLEAAVFKQMGRWSEVLNRHEAATNLDPRNYDVIAALADTYWRMRMFQEADDAVDRAIAVAPDRERAYVIKLGIYSSWYGPGRETRSVLATMPDRVPTTEWFWALQEYGERNYQAALDRLDRAPDQMLWTSQYTFPKPLLECSCYRALGRLDRARRACEAARKMLEVGASKMPDNPSVHVGLGGAYSVLGRKQDAITEARRALELMPFSKNAERAAQIAERAAMVYASAGEPETALDLIDQVLSAPGTLTVARLRLEPGWDPLRDHPRFQEILEKYGGGQ